MIKREYRKYVSVALILFGIVAMGVDSCAEPSKYCAQYAKASDRKECTAFCSRHKDFTNDSSRIDACRAGQFGYLSAQYPHGNAKKLTAIEVISECDRQFRYTPAQAQACRAGVAAEELRTQNDAKSSGTADDGGRETGNKHDRVNSR
jgi:hypothetical protein